jgi:hypothetical protein
MTRGTLKLTLLIPGLFALSKHELLELKRELPVMRGLNRMLSRAHPVQEKHILYEDLLASLFGIESPAPVAALTYLYDKKVSDDISNHEYVMYAEPVFMHADRDDLIMLAAKSLHVNERQALAFIEEVEKLYSDEPWRLIYGAPHRWYWIAGHDPEVETYPLHEVIGKSVGRYLPEGQAAKKWRALLNELQMLLHSHPVHGEVGHRDLNRVNSVWFWGGGKLPKRNAENFYAPWSAIWSNDPLAAGIGIWSGVPCATLPDSMQTWLDGKPQGEQLIVLDDLRLLARSDFGAWCHAVAQLGKSWIEPLAQHLKTGDIKQLRIHLCDRQSYLLQPSMLRKWWKKERPWFDFKADGD